MTSARFTDFAVFERETAITNLKRKKNEYFNIDNFIVTHENLDIFLRPSANSPIMSSHRIIVYRRNSWRCCFFRYKNCQVNLLNCSVSFFLIVLILSFSAPSIHCLLVFCLKNIINIMNHNEASRKWRPLDASHQGTRLNLDLWL